MCSLLPAQAGYCTSYLPCKRPCPPPLQRTTQLPFPHGHFTSSLRSTRARIPSNISTTDSSWAFSSVSQFPIVDNTRMPHFSELRVSQSLPSVPCVPLISCTPVLMCSFPHFQIHRRMLARPHVCHPNLQTNQHYYLQLRHLLGIAPRAGAYKDKNPTKGIRLSFLVLCQLSAHPDSDTDQPQSDNQRNAVEAVYSRLLQFYGIEAEANARASMDDLGILAQLLNAMPKEIISSSTSTGIHLSSSAREKKLSTIERSLI